MLSRRFSTGTDTRCITPCRNPRAGLPTSQQIERMGEFFLFFFRIKLLRCTWVLKFSKCIAKKIKKLKTATMSFENKKADSHAQVATHPVIPLPDISYSDPTNNRRDRALDFLDEHKNSAALEYSKDSAFTRGLRRKIEFRILPFLWICYTISSIDKVILNVRARILSVIQIRSLG